MTNKEKITLMESRMARLDGRGDKNVKSPGVKRKLERKLRKMREEEKN